MRVFECAIHVYNEGDDIEKMAMVGLQLLQRRSAYRLVADGRGHLHGDTVLEEDVGGRET